MSIPGLGQIPAQPVTEKSARSVRLRPYGEWRFEVSFHGTPVSVRLVAGTAEKDGTELALQHAYSFSGTKSKIMTWYGCDLEVTGACVRESVAEYAAPQDTAMLSYLNLHLKLSGMRGEAAAAAAAGPRVIVTGSPASGKTTLVRTLAAWATRMGAQPMVVNLDPKEDMLSLPGTLSAAVFATVMDIESTGGWGSTPTSGPSAVPVKLPLVYYFGHETPRKDPGFYVDLVGCLARRANARASEDPEVRSAGILIDAPAADSVEEGADMLAEVADLIEATIIVVLDSQGLSDNLRGRLGKRQDRQQVSILDLSKSDGAAERSDAPRLREAIVREYFFGQAGKALSPSTQTVDFDSLVIYGVDAEHKGETDAIGGSFGRISPTSEMESRTLAVVNGYVADIRDRLKGYDPESTSILGFVYVTQVDVDRKRMKLLSPVPGQLADRPLLWGLYPEAFYNLMG